MANDKLWNVLALFSHVENLWQYGSRLLGNDALTSKPNAETTAADFGKGFGDEQDLQKIYMKITTSKSAKLAGKVILPTWRGLLEYGLPTNHPNPVKRFQIDQCRSQLRLFLTSWDRATEIGTETETKVTKNGDTTDTLTKIKKITKGENTTNAVMWIAWVVEMIDQKERELNPGTHAPRNPDGTMNPAWQEARQLAFDHALSYLKQCGLYSLPLRGEPESILVAGSDAVYNWIKDLSTEEGQRAFIAETERRAQQPEPFGKRFIRRAFFGSR